MLGVVELERVECRLGAADISGAEDEFVWDCLGEELLDGFEALGGWLVIR